MIKVVDVLGPEPLRHHHAHCRLEHLLEITESSLAIFMNGPLLHLCKKKEDGSCYVTRCEKQLTICTNSE